MCGIAGVCDRRGRNLDGVEALAATLHHRGPDSLGSYPKSGAHLRGGAGEAAAVIAQSRLAVIDLVTGDPPITNEDGTIGVVLNGEIYNYRSLAAELAARGRRFATRCDTEVIAHLAEDCEPVALARRLDGMFAFAVWDQRRRRLVLGRDRFGKKPLYYWAGGGRLVFGSELKAVLADPGVPRTLDPGAVPAYLTFGYVPSPATFFEGVRSVPPGHVLTFDGDGVTLERYWEPPVPGLDGCTTLDVGLEEAAREVRRLLCDAVDRRLVADVPLGAFLSGGVDSSAVVAFMARLSPTPVRTFTIGFDDHDGFDERPFAAQVARRYGTDHTEFVVKADMTELVERLVYHHDQPFGDSSALPTFILSEQTRAEVTVALCGDGGDELFGGYERFAAALAMGRLSVLPPGVWGGVSGVLGRLGGGALGGRVASAQRLLQRLPFEMPDSYLSWLSYVPESWRQRLLDHPSDWGQEQYRSLWAATEGSAPLDRLLNLNLRTYLLDDLLPKVDRMAMAHGLEVRSPFLDTELAEFVLRLPPATKIAGMAQKRALKAAVVDLLPPEVLKRRKRGFGVPLDRWFRTDLASYIESMLCSPTSRCGQHLDAAALRELVADHQSGRANLGHALWTLLTLEVFLRHEGW
jgi:asparagine synthase (glutamine-hydrolysing)